MKLLLSNKLMPVEVEDIVNAFYAKTRAIPMAFDYMLLATNLALAAKDYEGDEKRGDIFQGLINGSKSGKSVYLKIPGDELYSFDSGVLSKMKESLGKIIGEKALIKSLATRISKKSEWLSANGNLAIIFNVGDEDIDKIANEWCGETLSFISRNNVTSIKAQNVNNMRIFGKKYSEIEKEIIIILEKITLSPTRIKLIPETKNIDDYEDLKEAT